MRFTSIVFVLAFLVLSTGTARAQLFETRGVWFATVLGDGDWPESPLDSAEKQEADLRDRIRTAAANGINTFVFQAVSRGDAMYPSERLPWSYRLTPEGGDPGYDPLAVAIDEAHKLGIELHAWINVFRVGDTGTVSRYEDAADPGHVYYEHPEWTKIKDTEIWLDPSSEEAREWLVGNVLEIVENYDVDAVHYDFIRYAQGGYSDDLDNCRFEGPCPDLGEWRRGNVTAFVQQSYNEIYAAKPWVKVGSTPIGNYKGPYDWGFFSAYDEAFQASRDWMPGFTDYLAPQIYWSIGQAYDPPRYEVLAEEWVRETTGPVFVGIAAYGADPAAVTSPFPPDDLPAQIDVARQVGADGQIFFRYDHFLKFATYIRPKYDDPALPARMTHRFEIQAPSVPQNLTIEKVGSLTAKLTWSPSEGSASDPLRAYAIFRREGAPPDISSEEDLYATSGATTFSEGFSAPPAADVYYAVASVSKLGELSTESNVVSTASIALASEGLPGSSFRILSLYPNPTPSRAVMEFEMEGASRVTVRVYDALGREVLRAFDDYAAAGRHDIDIDLTALSQGLYFVELSTDTARQTRRLIKQ